MQKRVLSIVNKVISLKIWYDAEIIVDEPIWSACKTFSEHHPVCM